MIARHIKGKMFHRVENDQIFVGEDDVGISVHNLDEKEKRFVVPHFGLGVERQPDYAVGVENIHAFNACVGQILA